MKRIVLAISLSAVLSYGLNVKSAYLKSYNYEKMCSCDEAIKVLIPVYKKYKNGYTINLRLGWLFYLDKKYNNAIKHYKKALISMPSSIEANLGLLRSYVKSGDLNNAIRVGNVILKIDYYNYYGNYNLVLALKKKKEYREALKLINKMLFLYPTSVIYLEQLADITNINDPKKAKSIYKNILILDPNNVDAKLYLSKH